MTDAVIDLCLLIVIALLIIGGLWLLWNATSEAWQEWRR